MSALPSRLEPAARWIVVTPQMHQVHHSIERQETDSNFGFNLPWWDRLFGTYRAKPEAGEQNMIDWFADFSRRRGTAHRALADAAVSEPALMQSAEHPEKKQNRQRDTQQPKQ